MSLTSRSTIGLLLTRWMVTDMTPEEKIKELQLLVSTHTREIAKLGVEHNIPVHITTPDGYHYSTLVNRSLLEYTLEKYGWSSSNEDEEISSLSDDTLLDAFENETGVETSLGSWMSSDALC